jgi:hypothetical protein
VLFIHAKRGNEGDERTLVSDLAEPGDASSPPQSCRSPRRPDAGGEVQVSVRV